jgi:hypothetical protein
VEGPLPLKTKIFVWQLLRDRLPSGVEVAKRHGLGDGLCPLCGIPELGTHIMFTYPATRFLWSFVQEALGTAWQARDLGEFLEAHANQTGTRRRLFWFMFAEMSWTLWITRNKMVIEKVFPRHASDSVFIILASLQLWYPLCRQWDRAWVDDMLRDLQEAARHLTMQPD